MEIQITGGPETAMSTFKMKWLESGKTFHSQLKRVNGTFVQKFEASHPGRYKVFMSNNKSYTFNVTVGSTSIQHTGTAITYKISKEKELSKYDYENFEKESSYHDNMSNKVNIKFWNEYWRNLHWFAHNYPKNPTENEQKQVVNLINAMKAKDGIPCPICLQHFLQWNQNHDIREYAKSGDKLFLYFWELHNDVNKRNRKRIVSLEEAQRLYSAQSWKEQLLKYKNDIVQMFKDGRLHEFPEHHLKIVKPLIRSEVYPE